jgi:hypothetical protein
MFCPYSISMLAETTPIDKLLPDSIELENMSLMYLRCSILFTGALQ